MQIHGVYLIRNEVDVIRLNALHHLAMGFDHLLIVDNGSSDGTDHVLRSLSRDKRIRWTRDNGAYRQAEITTELAREASRNGASWVAPLDADEFLYAPRRTIREVLAATTAGALCLQRVNFIQRREQRVSTPDALLHMTTRVAEPIGPMWRCRELVESRQIAWVEMMLPPKWISRASATIQIGLGNHTVSGVEGAHEQTDEIVMLHAPIRSRASLLARVEQGQRVAQPGTGFNPGDGWHVRRMVQLHEEGTLEQEWMANSNLAGCLDVYGAQHTLVFDPTLGNLVAPWIKVPAWKRFLRVRASVTRASDSIASDA